MIMIRLTTKQIIQQYETLRNRTLSPNQSYTKFLDRVWIDVGELKKEIKDLEFGIQINHICGSVCSKDNKGSILYNSKQVELAIKRFKEELLEDEIK